MALTAGTVQAAVNASCAARHKAVAQRKGSVARNQSVP